MPPIFFVFHLISPKLQWLITFFWRDESIVVFSLERSNYILLFHTVSVQKRRFRKFEISKFRKYFSWAFRNGPHVALPVPAEAPGSGTLKQNMIFRKVLFHEPAFFLQPSVLGIQFFLNLFWNTNCFATRCFPQASWRILEILKGKNDLVHTAHDGPTCDSCPTRPGRKIVMAMARARVKSYEAISRSGHCHRVPTASLNYQCQAKHFKPLTVKGCPGTPLAMSSPKIIVPGLDTRVSHHHNNFRRGLAAREWQVGPSWEGLAQTWSPGQTFFKALRNL